jgi:hypothetical protein
MSYRDGLILLSASSLPLIVLEIVKLFSRRAVTDWVADVQLPEGAIPAMISGRVGAANKARE